MTEYVSYDDPEFSKIWNSSSSVKEVMDRTGLNEQEVQVTMINLKILFRRNLKQMPNGIRIRVEDN